LIVVVAPEHADRVVAALSAEGESPRIIGEIARSTTSPRVRYER
jgi:hydrogenase maturation factor